MERPPEMIKCGWKDCENWFSTGIDMNQHVLINHIKFMKVQFVEADSATVVPKMDVPVQKQSEPLSFAHQIPHPPQPSQLRHMPDFKPSNHFPPMGLPRNLHPPPLQNYQQYFGDLEEAMEIKPASSITSDTIPDEPQESIGKVVRQDFDEDEIELDSDSETTPERTVADGRTPAKKSKTGDGVEKTPWSLAKHATHAPDRMIRLTSSYGTIGQMAKAITDELISRKTLRRKNRANGHYCIVCLDYRTDEGFCDFMHNNQQNHFIQYWTTLYGNEQIKKLTIVQQLTEMQNIEDLLPETTTAYVDPARGTGQF